MKQIEVTIMGQSYVLACPEGGESALLDSVSQVDKEMCAIRDAGKIKARERIAVLAALNLGYQLSTRPAARDSAAPAESSTQASINVDDLVQRLDQVLSEDGRLL